jgi:phosphoglycolate phosphatase
MQPLSLIFDLDGTLVDTAPDLINTLNRLLAEENCPPVAPALIRPMISEGAKAMLRRGFALAGSPRDEDQLTDLTARFIDHYAANIAVDSRPFPGLLAELDALRGEHVLGVCTNKRESLSKRLLAELAMDRYFAFVAGVDTLPFSKPHPGHLVGTVRALGGRPQRAVMIGDSETDIRTAQAAGIPVIALDFGYSQEPVATYHPDAILSDYRDLRDAIASLFPAG